MKTGRYKTSLPCLNCGYAARTFQKIPVAASCAKGAPPTGYVLSICPICGTPSKIIGGNRRERITPEELHDDPRFNQARDYAAKIVDQMWG